MSTLAATLEAFFSDRLPRQRGASSHTIAAYRDTFRLLLTFAHERTGVAPSQLRFADLDAACVGAFLEHLAEIRGNGVRTRNARLGAIHSFFRFAAFRHPEHADLIGRVLAIPSRRVERALVTFLSGPELEGILAAPDQRTPLGRRDHALLLLAAQTGLRLSELTGLTCADVRLGVGAHVRCVGKGRKERLTPLTRPTVAVLRAWLAERCGQPAEPLFPGRRGGRLSPDAVQRLVAKHATAAARRCPSLRGRRVTPHVLRHTSAMSLLRGGVDTTVIALWLGHEDVRTTQIYLHADLSLKERALARTAPLGSSPGRYRPPDRLLAFLESL
jgi:site-specific recombinase XerD